jgi:hypothetical protein
MSDPLIGINSPNRLLREQWKTPTDLAQELYAMLTAKGPREIHDTLTIRVPQGTPAIRVIRQDGDTSISETTHNFGVNKSSPGGPGNAFPAGRRPRPEPDQARRRDFGGQDYASRPRPGEPEPSPDLSSVNPFGTPDLEFDASAGFSGPVTFNRAVFREEPLFLDSTTGRFRTLKQIAEEITPLQPNWGGSGNAKVYGAIALPGQIGGSVQCNLYSGGWDKPLTDSTTGQAQVVTVVIPQIDPNEPIPDGMTFFPVIVFGGRYVAQPAVWGP